MGRDLRASQVSKGVSARADLSPEVFERVEPLVPALFSEMRQDIAIMLFIWGCVGEIDVSGLPC